MVKKFKFDYPFDPFDIQTNTVYLGGKLGLKKYSAPENHRFEKKTFPLKPLPAPVSFLRVFFETGVETENSDRRLWLDINKGQVITSGRRPLVFEAKKNRCRRS